MRPGLAALGVFNAEQLGCTNVPGGKDLQMTERSNQALQRHLTDTPAELPHAEVQMRSVQYMKEAAEAEGAGWPAITPAQAAELGADWNIFPNMVLVHSLDATLVFRAVPKGNDPESCLFEMASIGRHLQTKAACNATPA